MFALWQIAAIGVKPCIEQKAASISMIWVHLLSQSSFGVRQIFSGEAPTGPAKPEPKAKASNSDIGLTRMSSSPSEEDNLCDIQLRVKFVSSHPAGRIRPS
jgi:hypothetical protein